MSDSELKITGETSDGYHTFNELYEHRITLFIALCKMAATKYLPVWRSRVHSDGTSIPGWFVLGIGITEGYQITYHLPDARWDETSFAGNDCPEFDGHTSADVIERLKRL